MSELYIYIGLTYHIQLPLTFTIDLFQTFLAEDDVGMISYMPIRRGNRFYDWSIIYFILKDKYFKKKLKH